MPVLVIKSKEVMKILLRQIHQTGEVRGKLGASVPMLWQNSSHARSMSSQGRARYIAVRKLMLRALVLVSWMHYSSDGAQEFFFQTYSSDKPGGRVERKTLERVPVCILSSRMSCVVNAERTRQRGLLKKKNLRRVKIDIS